MAKDREERKVTLPELQKLLARLSWWLTCMADSWGLPSGDPAGPQGALLGSPLQTDPQATGAAQRQRDLGEVSPADHVELNLLRLRTPPPTLLPSGSCGGWVRWGGIQGCSGLVLVIR